jgi:O-methyltransferase
MKNFLKRQLNRFGFDVIKINAATKWPTDFEKIHKDIVTKARSYTMTSPERLFGLIEAVKYIITNNISGGIVECGVWKGGSMLGVAETLLLYNQCVKELYLYDTFEGMPPPSANDVRYDDKEAIHILQSNTNKERNAVWAYSTLDDVKNTMSKSQYPKDRIHYIVGKVEDTIPATIPEKIALLRLDTDWYESTKHELLHLYPRLEKGGVLIIDDYGFWKGARKAVDEYFDENKIPILLNRLDETGRIAVKL